MTTRHPESAPSRVVLAPDVIGKGLLTPACRAILEQWRDGHIRPVVTRDLLRLYLRLLRDMDVSEPVLRQWVLWFTAKGKSIFLSESAAETASIPEILHDAATRGHASIILSTVGPPSDPLDSGEADGPRWMLVD